MGRFRHSTPDPDVLAKEAKVVQLRRAMIPFTQIAEEVGYASAEQANKAYKRAIMRIPMASVEEMRREQADMLDRLHAQVWRTALQGDLDAVTAVLKIFEQRAKLLGLYAPVKAQVEVTDNTRQRIVELVDQIRSLPPVQDELASKRDASILALPSGTSQRNPNSLPG